MILLSSMAHALTCSPGDLACNGANVIRDQINFVYGTDLIKDDASNQRFRTNKIRKGLQDVIAAADEGDCVIDGFVAMEMDRGENAIDGLWSNEFGESAVEASGNFGGGDFGGAWNDGGFGGHFGDDFGFGNYQGEKLIGDWDTGEGPGFMAGRYHRAQGRRIYGWAATGYCESNFAQSFDDWYPGDLSEHYSEPEVTTWFITDVFDNGGCASFGGIATAPLEYSCVEETCVLEQGGETIDLPGTSTPMEFQQDDPSAWSHGAPGNGSPNGTVTIFDAGPFAQIDIYLDDGEQDCLAYGFSGDFD